MSAKEGQYKYSRANPERLRKVYYQQPRNLLDHPQFSVKDPNHYSQYDDPTEAPWISGNTDKEKYASYLRNSVHPIYGSKEAFRKYSRDSDVINQNAEVVVGNMRRAAKAKRESYDKLMAKSKFKQLPDDVMEVLYGMAKPSARDVMNMKKAVGGNGLKPYQVKGSKAAKTHMKALRALRRPKF
jgi:hypothetical protein